jgi:hypothetical protein
LLEQVVGFAADQGLSRGSRVEITPWLFPNQICRSQDGDEPRGGVISPRPAKDSCTSLSVCDGGDEAKDGEEDFELFAKETVRERMERRIYRCVCENFKGKLGSEVLVSRGMDHRMGLRGWEGLRLPGSMRRAWGVLIRGYGRVRVPVTHGRPHRASLGLSSLALRHASPQSLDGISVADV